MNNQRQIKQNLSINGSTDFPLIIKEIFYTIQGEGKYSGHPAIFIRVGGGCTLNCYWCDTSYEDGKPMTNIDILNEVDFIAKSQAFKPIVVITGGEPFQYNINELVHRLYNNNYSVHIETSGSVAVPDFPYSKTFIVCSPKTSRINPLIHQKADIFKYVLQHDQVSKDDGLPFTNTQDENGQPRTLARPKYCAYTDSWKTPVYITPCDDGEYSKNILQCVESSLKYGYIFNLQMHKIVGVD